MHAMTDTQRSWDIATRNHNSHKGNQARFFRDGGDVLFPEELALLGDLSGRSLVHLQCNCGQDTLCLARRGADVTGVDFSAEAIGFARRLASDIGQPARFVHAELLQWLHTTEERYERAFSSYGAVCWIPDLAAWAAGIERVLRPGGRFVYVEFHPLVWSLGKDLSLTGDDYFRRGPYVEPVADYVAEAGGHLASVEGHAPPPLPNPVDAESWQYGLAEIVQALTRAGLHLEELHEYPHSNGARIHPTLEPASGRRYVWPEGRARVPLMFGLSARKPGP